MSYMDPFNPLPPRPDDKRGATRPHPADSDFGARRAASARRVVCYWAGFVGLLVLGVILFGSAS